MVSWSADGDLTGYHPTTKKLQTGIYKFASPGTVDVNASTRLGYPLAPSYSSATYPNRLEASASLTYSAADATANPGKKFCAAMFIAPSTAFAAGVVPTPDQIRLAPGVRVYRGSHYRSTFGPLTIYFTGSHSPAPGTLPHGVKHWVAIIPTALTDINSPWSVANDKPVAGNAVNTMGRALSFWPDRSPTAPVITSPTGNSVILPGDTFTLTYDSNDPDEVTPDDMERYNRDLAGVQIQYAPAATVENPSPEWRPLPFEIFKTAEHFRGDGGGPIHSAATRPILKNRGLPILCGDSNEFLSGHGNLPGGEWQLRVRTFDFGHPYPATVNPLGIVLGPNNAINPDNYPATHVSPWSTPVRVTVPVQVPPPIPIYPTDSIAVQEDQTVRLSWLYRNTFQPAYEQARRTVQIRRVGDEDWVNIFDGYSPLPYVDLPPVLDNPAPGVPTQYLTDLGFEGGTEGGWIFPPPIYGAGTGTVVNTVAAVPGSHAGTHHASVTIASLADSPGFYQEFAIGGADDSFTFEGWVGVDANIAVYIASIGWFDVDGNEVTPAEPPPSALVYRGAGWADEWNEIVLADAPRPPSATTVAVLVLGIADAAPATLRLDDVSLLGSSSVALGDFTIEATTQYEWRVQAQDEDGAWSNFSESARFWVVDAGQSGDVKPLPASSIEGATLGCGSHTVEVYRRGGLTPVGKLKGTSVVEWGRTRDDISTAKIVVKDWDIDCGNLLASLQTWAYEVVIYRNNGTSIDRVWEGPITLLTYEENEVEIQAKDVMAYLYRRIIKQRMNDSGTGNGTTVTDRAARIIRNVMAPDDPNLLAYLTVLERPDDPMQYRSTPAYSRTAFEEVDDMAANAGLDYTAVGRRILLWSTKHRIGTLPEFKDEDLGSPPKVSEYGMSMANRYVVSDGNGVWGEATRLDVSGNDPVYGLVEMLSSTWASDSTEDSGTYTQEGLQTVIESFEGYAERSIADRYGPPVVVRVPDNTTLNPGTVLSIQHLVPGVVVPLRSFGTLRKVVATQKLDSIRVSESEGKETITITLSPFNRDDVDAGGEGGEDA